MYSSTLSHPTDSSYYSGCSYWKPVKRELSDEEKSSERDGTMSEDSRDMDKKMKVSDYDQVNSQEEEKKRQRRERNKLAAAKCRQRRVDLTNALLSETEKLENEKSRLEEEIKVLEIQKSELQNILDSHSIDCTNTVKEDKPYFDARGINSGFVYENVGLPYGAMEDPHTVNGSGPSQYKGMAASSYLYQSPAGLSSKSMQYKNSHFDGSVPNKNDYKNLNGSQFVPPFTKENQSYPPSNPFPVCGNSIAVDLSNPSQGFRMDPRQPNHDPLGYMGVYKHPSGQDQGVRYADISCLKAAPMKHFHNDQDLSKNYQNNNYMVSHSTMFYKNNSDAYAESCLVAANSNNFHYETKSSCSRAYPSPLDRDNFKPDVTSSCLPDSGMRASPCYQKTLESVLKVESQCGMGLQALSHHSTS